MLRSFCAIHGSPSRTAITTETVFSSKRRSASFCRRLVNKANRIG
jgi:hypothetical protein